MMRERQDDLVNDEGMSSRMRVADADVQIDESGRTRR
jgi:hypothetical protein